MNRISLLFMAALLSLFLVACGGVDEIDSEKADAKVSEEATPASSDSEKEEVEEADEEDPDDIWTYYNDANWEGDFNGLRTEIQKVVVTEKAPTLEDENAEESAVGVKFLVENTTEHKFDTYPDQATLVTSTGEQVEADMLLSDNIGGTIDKGVIKEGDVIFYLERGEAEAIEWIKLEWNTTDLKLEEDGDYENSFHTDEVELQLK